MADPDLDLPRKAVSDALCVQHEAYQPSQFESDWAAALSRQAEAGSTPRRRLFRPASLAHDTAWFATAATVLVISVALISTKGPDRGGNVETELSARLLSQSHWYSQTDVLLTTSAWRYASGAATVTTYDAINLEVVP